MLTLDFLNRKELKHIAGIIKDQWNSNLPDEFAYLLRKDGDLFMLNRDVAELDFSRLKINSLGLYIGELRHEELRLSIEGAQLLGPAATKNVVVIDANQLKRWLRGEILPLPQSEAKGFVILKHRKDFVGCGKVSDHNILNYVPKNRRIKS